MFEKKKEPIWLIFCEIQSLCRAGRSENNLPVSDELLFWRADEFWWKHCIAEQTISPVLFPQLEVIYWDGK